ncbi:hypothetical protein NC653_005070 [Populus alba x Populus x berolinensis]|uniref:Uncharacterized protein n=1 Tax=Populus alba x Populus x berolinensis TaxID=444605 RepID=A0AAD6RB20_9ROSI|nr:hypothetical protein NC653_005070 [Populus alba x Populus x berolinensis]
MTSSVISKSGNRFNHAQDLLCNIDFLSVGLIHLIQYFPDSLSPSITICCLQASPGKLVDSSWVLGHVINLGRFEWENQMFARDEKLVGNETLTLNMLHCNWGRGLFLRWMNWWRRPGVLARYMKVRICINENFIEIIIFSNANIVMLRCLATASYAPGDSNLDSSRGRIHAPTLSLWGVKNSGSLPSLLLSTLSSIALSTRVQPGLEQKIVLPRDSYLQGYFNNVSEYLRIGPPLYFVVKNYNYR